MNTYRLSFYALCPNNNVRIHYRLQISTVHRFMVEDLIDAVTLIDRGFHEDIADQLHREFGGAQVLIAQHHGVEIETRRGGVGSA